jgi:hypothetical protein
LIEAAVFAPYPYLQYNTTEPKNQDFFHKNPSNGLKNAVFVGKSADFTKKYKKKCALAAFCVLYIHDTAKRRGSKTAAFSK